MLVCKFKMCIVKQNIHVYQHINLVSKIIYREKKEHNIQK